jgi:hypothetical protein
MPGGVCRAIVRDPASRHETTHQAGQVEYGRSFTRGSASVELAWHDEPPSFERWSFVSGIVASVLFIVGTVVFVVVIAPDLPGIGAPAIERATFYRAMSDNALYRSISYLGAAQMMFMLLFFGGLFGVLRRAEGATGALSFGVFGAGIAVSLIAPLAILVEDHLMLGFAASGIDPMIVSSIDGLGPLSFALGGFPQAIVLAGTSVVLHRRRQIPIVLAWVGYLLALASIVGTGTLMRGAMFPLSSLSMVLFRLWLIALCLSVLWRGGRDALPSVGLPVDPARRWPK